MLGVKWQDRVKNIDIADRTGLPNIADIISKMRQALFGHVVRLDVTTPAHRALCQVIAMKGGQSLGMNWRRPPGRSRKTWIQQIGNGTPASWRQMWQSADERGHRGGVAATDLSCLRVMMMMMMMRTAKNDLQLQVFRRREVQSLTAADRLKRLNACKRLKKRMTQNKISRTWFSDEKIFTVETPSNSQNDRVYANVKAKRDVPPSRLLKPRKHFTKSVMVSVAVSKLGKTSLVFVESGAKVNIAYYCDLVLKNGLLPDIHRLSGNKFKFQQDGAPSHRSKQTVAFLQANVPDFIEPPNWPPNSPDLNPVHGLLNMGCAAAVSVSAENC